MTQQLPNNKNRFQRRREEGGKQIGDMSEYLRLGAVDVFRVGWVVVVGLGVVFDLVLGWWGVLVGLGFAGGCVGW